MREVLSYSRRGSRFTPSQAQAWEAHARRWVIPDEEVDDPGFSWPTGSAARRPGRGDRVRASARPPGCWPRRGPTTTCSRWRCGGPGSPRRSAEVAAAGATNVRFCSVDAAWALEHLVAPGGLAGLWTFFPDPWPKTRHHKRRLVDARSPRWPPRGWRPGATWRLATDWRTTPSRCARSSTPNRCSGAWSALGRAPGHQVRAQGRGGRPADHRPAYMRRAWRRGAQSGSPRLEACHLEGPLDRARSGSSSGPGREHRSRWVRPSAEQARPAPRRTPAQGLGLDEPLTRRGGSWKRPAAAGARATARSSIGRSPGPVAGGARSSRATRGDGPAPRRRQPKNARTRAARTAATTRVASTTLRRAIHMLRR